MMLDKCVVDKKCDYYRQAAAQAQGELNDLELQLYMLGP